jgi:hypothetical protein
MKSFPLIGVFLDQFARGTWTSTDKWPSMAPGSVAKRNPVPEAPDDLTAVDFAGSVSTDCPLESLGTSSLPDSGWPRSIWQFEAGQSPGVAARK